MMKNIVVVIVMVMVWCTVAEKAAWVKDLGVTRLSVSEQKVAIYVDLKPFRQAILTTADNVEQLKKICLVRKDNCAMVVASAESNVKLLKQTWLQLVNEQLPDGQLKTRTRRGLINIGGSLLKFVFGTMDNDDAERYTKQINELQFASVAERAEAKREKKILNSLIEFQERAVNELNNQTVLINELQNGVKNSVNELLYLAHHATLVMQGVAWQLNSLLTTLTIGQKAHFYSNVVPHEGMKEIIEGIRLSLPSYLALPFTSWGEDFFNIIEVRLAMSTSAAIFELSLPVVVSAEFKAYKVTKMMVLMESEDFERTVAPWSSWSDCRKSKVTICRLEILIEKYNENGLTCIQRLRRGSAVGCDVMKLEVNKTLWIKGGDGLFAYAAPEPDKVVKVCKGNSTEETVHGDGVIKVEAGCRMTSASVVIYAEETKAIEKCVEPAWQITDVGTLSEPQTKLPLAVQMLTTADLMALQEELNEDVSLGFTSTPSGNIQPYVTMGLVLLVLVLIYVIRYGCRKLGKIKKEAVAMEQSIMYRRKIDEEERERRNAPMIQRSLPKPPLTPPPPPHH